MLDHPEEMWRNYYRYYRRRVGPKVDVRLVLAVTISLISAGQYYFAWTNYNEAIKCLAAIPKYRIQVLMNHSLCYCQLTFLVTRQQKLPKERAC